MTLHDGPATGGRHAAVRGGRAGTEAALEGRLRALGNALDGEPDPAFRAATRTRLVAMAAVRSPAPARVTGWRRLLALRADSGPSRRRTRLTAALAGAALTVTVLATLVAVSAGARPGDVLYGLKRGTEQSQLALAGDARGRTLLQFAGTRLAELRGLSGDGDAALAVTTLQTMDRETTAAASWLGARAVRTRGSAPVDDLAAWARGQRAGLAALRPQLPAGARPPAAHSLDLLSQVGARADALAAAVSCPAGPAVRGIDALGPVPAPCPAPPPSGRPAAGGTSGASHPAVATPTPAPASGRTAGTAGHGTSGTVAGPTGQRTTTGPGPVRSSPATAPTSSVAVPLPTLPPLPLPVPVPGAPAGGPSRSTGPSGSGGAPSSPPGVAVCVPPLVTIGNC